MYFSVFFTLKSSDVYLKHVSFKEIHRCDHQIFSRFSHFPWLLQYAVSQCCRDKTPAFYQCSLNFFWHIFFQTLKKHIKRLKHHKFETCLSYKAKRLASRFQLKDHVKKKHVDNMVYKIECPDCESFYIGESGRGQEERFKDHNGRDKNKHTSTQWNLATTR